MKVAVEYIKWLTEERQKINKTPLEEIEFYENGMKVDVSEKMIKDFKFVGLNNIDFITSDFYKENNDS
jgi:hypothetical protein